MIRHGGRRAVAGDDEEGSGWVDPRASKTNLIPENAGLFNQNYSLTSLAQLIGEAPDGSNNAHRAIAGSATGNARVGHREYAALTVGNTYTMSAYLRRRSGTYCLAFIFDAYNNGQAGIYRIIAPYVPDDDTWYLLEREYTVGDAQGDYLLLWGSSFWSNHEFDIALPMLYAGLRVT